MATAEKVTTSKPLVGGGAWVAPLGTALPTDATSTLGDAFKDLGFISNDGIKNSNKASTSNITAWGGKVVATVQTEKPDTYQFTLIEATNLEALKLIYGDSNVSGDIATGITIKANSDEATEHVVVIDMKLREDALKRIVIPRAKVTEVDDISYKDSDAISYGTTISCTPDDSGNTHYEYIIQKKATNSASGS